MFFLDLCAKRQSTRKYAAREIPREVLERCLEAARLAPSACNSQPWYFIVVDDKKLKDELSDNAFSGAYSMNAFAKSAAVLVVVVTKRSTYAARIAGFFKGTQYALIDIGIACEHLVLQAAEEGVGSCWLGWFNEKTVKQTLGLGMGDKVDIIISLGYSAEGVELRKKLRKPLYEIRVYNKGR